MTDQTSSKPAKMQYEIVAALVGSISTSWINTIVKLMSVAIVVHVVYIIMPF